MDKVLKRLKELKDEDSRYAYADAVTNTFLASQIKQLLKERGLKQEQLASLIGTKQSGISRWMNTGFSTCKVETLRKFAKAYGVRLRISFEEFGTLPTDVNGFTKSRLAPRKFEDDPAFNLKEKATNATAESYKKGVAFVQIYADGLTGGQGIRLHGPIADVELTDDSAITSSTGTPIPQAPSGAIITTNPILRSLSVEPRSLEIRRVKKPCQTKRSRKQTYRPKHAA